jgi:hypothetical protein
MFGTGRIDFGTPATTFTFRASDMDLPMRRATPTAPAWPAPLP